MLALQRMICLTAVACSLAIGVTPAHADPTTATEAATELRVFQVETQVATQGTLRTADGPGKTRELPMQATARFRFRERRLAAAGRDALAFRALRDYESARMQATIDKEPTGLELPAASSLIVAAGQREGVLSYSFRTLLTRDQLDLLNYPGDPLALLAILPEGPVDTGSEWTAPEWAAQMLAGIEAVETARLTGQVTACDAQEVKMTIQGSVRGIQEGAKTTVDIQGELVFDRPGQYLRTARLTGTIQGDIGVVAPGVTAQVTVQMDRRPTQEAGQLTDAVVEATPLEPPARALQLAFDAAPWRVRLRHDRNWYVFQAIFDTAPKVAILRLVEKGSLICQCNLSPIPDAPPGRHTPAEEFEQDIRRALGKSFREIRAREVTPLNDGRTLVQVVAAGETQLEGKTKEGERQAIAIPMEWRYYILADRSGRQVSFVFALEQGLAAALGTRDRELVQSLEFLLNR